MKRVFKKIADVTATNHPTYKGVTIKPIFSAEETDGKCNNLEVHVQPNSKIEKHKHDNSSKFYYVIDGKGRFFVADQWYNVNKGDALIAPQGKEHAFENNDTKEELVLFSTFVPPNVPPKKVEN